MYLLTTINEQEMGWEIHAEGTKKECAVAQDDLIKKVWYEDDGTQKMMSCIYDDTRAKNSCVVTNAKAAKMFGGKMNLETYKDIMLEEKMSLIDYESEQDDFFNQ